MITTYFSQLIGNEAAKSYLQRMIAKKAVANSLLFAGPDGIGKSLFAQALAAELMEQEGSQGKHRQKIAQGIHPDIHIYHPEGKLGLHSIQVLRQLGEEVYLPPFEASWKVFIIHEADRMLSYSANALLKTFEEPPSNTLIILLSSAPTALIPTILSRCRVLHFQFIEELEIQKFLRMHYELDEKNLLKIASLAHGSLSRAIYLAKQGGDSNRDIVLNILATGKIKTYKALLAAVQVLTEQIESAKKEAETAAKEMFSKVALENLSAIQQQALEKELEGAVSMSQMQQVHFLLQTILAWYRDLHLFLLTGQVRYMIHSDYYPQIEQIAQRGNILPLEDVQKAIKETLLSLQRSTSLEICLENLFLKLHLVD